MYNNWKNLSMYRNFKMYRDPGEQVLNVALGMELKNSMYESLGFESMIASDSEIKAAMADKIVELGPTNVSNHGYDPSQSNVLDLSGIKNQRDFINL